MTNRMQPQRQAPKVANRRIKPMSHVSSSDVNVGTTITQKLMREWQRVASTMESIEQLAQASTSLHSTSQDTTVAWESFKDTVDELDSQVTSLKRHRHKLHTLRKRRHKEIQDAQTQLDTQFTVVKLTPWSTGRRRTLWDRHMASLNAKRDTQEIERIVHTIVECVLRNQGDIRHYRHARTRQRPKQRRTTFYMCSGALDTTDGVCRSVHCSHSGRQTAGITHARSDICAHIRRVHRVKHRSDGYEGCGLLESE